MPVLAKIKGHYYLDGRPVSRYRCNGCGSTWTAWLVPDWLPFMPMYDICCRHDFRYVCGGSEYHRQVADAEFRDGILSLKQGRCRFIQRFIERVANRRWRVVRALGDCGSFEFTKSGEPRRPVYLDGEVYFYDDELA